MPKLILRIRRGGRLLGSWSLGDEPLDMAVFDVVSGKELATFTAQAGGIAGHDEVPIALPRRLEGDDLTMPLPEPTDTGDVPSTEEVPAVRVTRRKKVKNLARGGRQPGDDFTVPQPEPTVTADLPRKAVRALEDEWARDVAPPEDTDPDLTGGVSEITLGEPIVSVPAMDEERPTDSMSRNRRAAVPENTQELRTGEIEPVEIPPAEVWVRQRNEWHAAGHLVPGQRVLDRGGWVRLSLDGRLVACAGDRMEGSATLLDGRTVGISAGQDAISLPAGASVLLRLGDHGLYVRSEPLPDTTGSVVYDAMGNGGAELARR